MKSFKQRLGQDKSARNFKKTWELNTLRGAHRANFELWREKFLSEKEQEELHFVEQLALYERFLLKTGLIENEE